MFLVASDKQREERSLSNVPPPPPPPLVFSRMERCKSGVTHVLQGPGSQCFYTEEEQIMFQLIGKQGAKKHANFLDYSHMTFTATFYSLRHLCYDADTDKGGWGEGSSAQYASMAWQPWICTRTNTSISISQWCRIEY